VLEVRSATAVDDSTLRAIDLATWSTQVSPAPVPAEGQPFFGERLSPDDVLVAVRDGEVVGYVTLRPGPLPSNAHVVQVNGLAVHPSHQRQGVARRLLDEAATRVRRRGARKLTLRVLGHNAAARRLYASCGYVVEGVLVDEFVLDGVPVDDVFMARFLD
jgi:ribosomal protein S18 acetylase RimI-like enzyme